MKGEIFNIDKILSLKSDADEGFIFEVDLKYPKELHDLHNDYPLATERFNISKDMLSPYNCNFLQEHFKSMKLVPNLIDKKKFVMHYRNLQLYLKIGMKLEKIH